jgi:hypothetical protein
MVTIMAENRQQLPNASQAEGKAALARLRERIAPELFGGAPARTATQEELLALAAQWLDPSPGLAGSVHPPAAGGSVSALIDRAVRAVRDSIGTGFAQAAGLQLPAGTRASVLEAEVDARVPCIVTSQRGGPVWLLVLTFGEEQNALTLSASPQLRPGGQWLHTLSLPPLHQSLEVALLAFDREPRSDLLDQPLEAWPELGLVWARGLTLHAKA